MVPVPVTESTFVVRKILVPTWELKLNHPTKKEEEED
jgi:hypothetical protein